MLDFEPVDAETIEKDTFFGCFSDILVKNREFWNCRETSSNLEFVTVRRLKLKTTWKCFARLSNSFASNPITCHAKFEKFHFFCVICKFLTWNGPQFGMDQHENSFALYPIEIYAKFETFHFFVSYANFWLGMDLNLEWINMKIDVK